MGTELDIVNAARVSFAKESTWETEFTGYNGVAGTLAARDEGLLNFLMRERHGTPFEMGFIAHWHVRAPLAVFYEWHRHRIGMSYNEESGRYTEMRPDFYVPEGDSIRTQVGKPGAYSFEPITDPGLKEFVTDSFDQVYYLAYAKYRAMVESGIAKELARMVLPVGLYKEMRVVTNARSLMSFLSLRADKNAQEEIRRYAEAMEEIFAKHMPVVHKAWDTHGRVAP